MSKKVKNSNPPTQGKNNKGKGLPSNSLKIPKTVQESIPYVGVYKNGIIEIEPGIYTKSYALEDVNFKIATQEEQEAIFLAYGDLLNTFGPEVKAQITINNRNIDKDTFQQNVLMPMRDDTLNMYREEYNNMLMEKMSVGRNNLAHEKYLTIAIEAENIEAATSTFITLDNEISTRIKRINGVETFPMTLTERLEILYDIYNLGHDGRLYEKATINGREVESLDLEWIKKMGLTTKDVIGPSSLEFYKDYFMSDNKYGRSLFLDNLPSYLSAEILSDISSTPINMLTSVHFESIRQDKSLKMIRNQMVNINSNVIDAQKKAARSGYSPDLISPELMRAQDEANKLLGDMTSRNQKLFFASIVITHFADTLEDLNKDTKGLMSTVSKHLCQIKKLNYQQEYAFTTSLPLCNNKLFVKRMLTTESASIFIPFSAQELSQRRGMYYGLNAVSKNMILFNRINSKNQNGVILGTPGSGKSFTAKREIVNVLLNTEDEVYIVDPEGEYTSLAQLLGGEVVRIAAGSKVHINPMDMDLDYADEDDPITLKSDFISSLCETIIGGHYGLSPVQKSVIDRCVRQLYVPYCEYLRNNGKTFDTEKAPTLIDFHSLLLSQPEPEAQNLAVSLELYCIGSLDTFAHKTNVNTRSRFVVYDIKNIGSGMKEMGLQVCLNDIWNKIISNKKRGKRTWFYLDEFYLLTQTDSSARFLQQIWKRSRKWGGIPTGITQNVEDLLASKEARGIINNCDFILMLNQSPLDRAELAAMLNISPAQLSYITNSDAGQGLIYTGKSIVPFIDKFPTDTELYKVMTTKPDESNAS